MRILLIGGTGFIGSFVAADLVRRGHDVVVFHRGPTDAGAARQMIGDRNRLPELAAELRALALDVVIDLILSSGRQARDLMNVFRGVAARVVALRVPISRLSELI